MARTFKGELSATQVVLGLVHEFEHVHEPGASVAAVGTAVKRRFKRSRFDGATAHKMLPQHAKRGLALRLNADEDQPPRAEDCYRLLDPGRGIVEDLMYAAPIAEPRRRDAVHARLALCDQQRLPALIARTEGEIVVWEKAFADYKKDFLKGIAGQGDWRTDMDNLQLEFLSNSSMSMVHRLGRVAEQLTSISAKAGRGSVDVVTEAFCEDGELSASMAVLAVVVRNPGVDVALITGALAEHFEFAPFTRTTSPHALETLERHRLVSVERRRGPRSRRKSMRAGDRVYPTEKGVLWLDTWMYAKPIEEIPPVRDLVCARLELCQPQDLPRVIKQVEAEAQVFATASAEHRHNLQDRKQLLAPGRFRTQIEVVQLEYLAERAIERTHHLLHIKEELETYPEAS